MSFLTRIGRWFPRNNVIDSVQTVIRFEASPDEVWRAMLFYEEVPQRPMPLLRWFLPMPIRTSGEKTRPGSLIRCTYDGGSLMKQITAAEPGRFVRFEVLVQRLGIEECITMSDGSYELAAEGAGTMLVLTTRYVGHVRPRWLARVFERYLTHRMHRHILDGMRAMIKSPLPALASARASVGDA